ncbi:hypothetical protein WICMUC_002005 [Wickerhamomyces mucosus]|uniref:Fumarate reductase n=1 Tax=Wickerhamomyces mucosus TaxID=1378264 RepID=A0A9P8PRX7_9ASCO|nr:hypothetical protein WICMUC_002005 [Wickerhamomyces mucosus]
MSNIVIQKTPVVVVGSGLAGLTATYKLLQQKTPVILIEKLDKFGGNSIKASSGINGAFTSVQQSYGLDDSVEIFLKDTIKSAKSLGDLQLQETLVNESKKAIEWLQQEISVSLNIVNQLGGHSTKRTHRSDGIPPGFEIISKLQKKVLEFEGLDIKFNSKLISIDSQNDKIIGLKYLNLLDNSEIYLKTNNLIVATGGFGFSKKLLQKYKPELVDFPTTNGAQTLGEGQEIISSIGGSLIDMEQVQIHPTGFIKQDDRENNWKFLAAESLRGVGGILLNSSNERFVNELETRDTVSNAILKQKDQKATLVLNEDMYQEFKFQIDFYSKMKLLEKTTIAEKFKDDTTKVIELLKKYSQQPSDSNNKDENIEIIDQYGRESKQHVFKNVSADSIIFSGEITPVVHFTMGGVKINTNGQVINTKDQIIDGLYAIGEVSGGVHGANRLGGNSLLECTVFGNRVAQHIINSDIDVDDDIGLKLKQQLVL